MNRLKFLVLLVVWAYFNANSTFCIGQSNRYTRVTPTNFQPTYTSPNYDALYQLGAALQKREDQNRQYRANLIDWIQKIKSETTDYTFHLALDRLRNNLVAIDNLKHVTCVARLDQIKFDIQSEIDKYNIRQRELPNKLWLSGSEKFKQKNYSGAIDDYTSLINLSPNYLPAYLFRAVSYSQVGDFAIAIRDLDVFLANTEDAKAYDLRANCKVQLGDHIGALADYNKQIALDPENGYAYYNRGETKSSLGDSRGAIIDYDKCISIEPNFSMVYNNRGWANFNLKNYSQAITDLNKAIKLDAENWVAYDSRADVRYVQNNLKGCVEDCLKTISINPKCSNSYLLLGKCYQRQGQLENACIQLSKAGELGAEQAYELIRKYCQ